MKREKAFFFWIFFLLFGFFLLALSSSQAAPKAAKGKVFTFAGYQWERKSRNFPAGPGPNYFNLSKRNVWIDNGQLHLKMTNKDGKWYCAGVNLKKSFGYGIYMIETNSRIDLLDPMSVFGMFIYAADSPKDAFKELDFEYARWGRTDDSTNSQFVVQSIYSEDGSRQRYRVNLGNEDKCLTHYLIWQPDKIEFRTYRGKYSDSTPPAKSALVSSLNHTGKISVPGNEKFKLNLWLFKGLPPLFGQPDEVVISKFLYFHKKSLE